MARPIVPRLAPATRVIGFIALSITAGVHAWLYFNAGYRYIPTIGPAFLATTIVAVALGTLVGANGSLLLAPISAAFLASVFGGYVLSTTVGLFGFTETGETTAAVICGVAEVGGVSVLMAGAWRGWWHHRKIARSSSSPLSVANNRS